MARRILLGYATNTGSTAGVAEAIGEELARRGDSVDVRPLKEKPTLDGYDAVVLGSAINGGQWLPDALSYVEGNREALGALPVSVFCVHAMNCGDEPKKVKRRQAYLDPVRAMISPVAEGYFAGKGPEQAETGAVTRWMFRAFGGDVEGDGRDFDAIRAWARGLPT